MHSTRESNMKDKKENKLPTFTVKVNTEPSWFTKAIDRVEKGLAPFKKSK